MSLTRIDCNFVRGKAANFDTSSYVALNPCCKPGSLVIAGASAARGTIGGQVACRLSLEHFVEGVLEYFDLEGSAAESQSSQVLLPGVDPQQERSVQVLEAAFKRANSSVYNFGHKLAAGGRMAASLQGLVIHDSSIAAGRVGLGSIYLFRDGELFPFFEKATSVSSAASSDAFVGSQSLVSVELASVPCAEDDLVLLFASELEPVFEAQLRESVAQEQVGSTRFWSALSALTDSMAFSMLARLGPQAIYLKQQAAF